MERENVVEISIQRPLYDYEQVRKNFQYEEPKKNFFAQLLPKKVSLKDLALKTFPVLEWLPKYQWKTELMADLIAGYTIAVMNIPQGMAYALLANCPAVVGIYMAIFPPLVYFVFGTCKQASVGSFAITCLLTGKAVLEHADPAYFDTTDTDVTPTGYSPLQIGCALSLLSGFIQLLMYCLRLGAVSALLSDVLVKAFVCGSAYQIVITQIKDLVGIHMPKISGNFLTIKTLKVIFDDIQDVNYAALIISVTAILVMLFNNEYLKPIVAKKSSVPIPIELIVVIIVTLISRYARFNEKYGVKIIGDIPTGLPEPSFPDFDVVPKIITDGISMSIVSYALLVSVALMLAQKGNYEVDPNQELLALGLSNVIGSCFSCIPTCSSLTRSVIQEVVGGKTQMVSIVVSLILTITLLWIAPFFEALPKSILACIIVVSLKNTLTQIKDFVKIWKLSKIDGMVWLSTFIAVVFVSMEVALMVGLALSLFCILLLNFKPYSCILGSIPHTDVYLDTERYKGAVDIRGIKIFHYCGGMNFASKNIYKNNLYDKIGMNPQRELIYRRKLDKLEGEMKNDTSSKNGEKILKLKEKLNFDLKYVILDFSSVSGLDPCTADMLQNEITTFRKLGITIYIAACSGEMYNTLRKCRLVNDGKDSLMVFLTVHDAVQTAVNKMREPSVDGATR
ncbi:sulfate transporter-like isoform X1 [Diorhabda carinulata]|uniref:sulfate transporter-like isoform X1 n=1 Tax=Diorhabda carinulata TaxID=1163345 RepID=UPI0025A24188|nr:sulfate transporter-like isoform X1 [Diorhabda carinulata]